LQRPRRATPQAVLPGSGLLHALARAASAEATSAELVRGCGASVSPVPRGRVPHVDHPGCAGLSPATTAAAAAATAFGASSPAWMRCWSGADHGWKPVDRSRPRRPRQSLVAASVALLVGLVRTLGVALVSRSCAPTAAGRPNAARWDRQ